VSAQIEERLARIEAKLDVLDENSNKLLSAIFGNGKPGFFVRMDRIEQREADRKWTFRAIFGGLVALFVREAYRILEIR